MTVKKIAFCLAVVALLVSCGRHEWDDTVVTNNSHVVVEFKFNHTGVITLVPEESFAFETRAHQHLEWFEYEYMHNGETRRARHGTPKPEDGKVWFFYTATDDGANGEFRLAETD